MFKRNMNPCCLILFIFISALSLINGIRLSHVEDCPA